MCSQLWPHDLLWGSLFFLACSLYCKTSVHSWTFLPSPPTSTSIHPSSQPVSHLTSQPTLITSPPPKGSYFLIAWPSCSGIPEINSPPLCYSYYLGVLELACPSKQTLYSAFFLTLPPLATLSVLVHYSQAWDVPAGCGGE